jgi:hypothetical protein
VRADGARGSHYGLVASGGSYRQCSPKRIVQVSASLYHSGVPLFYNPYGKNLNLLVPALQGLLPYTNTALCRYYQPNAPINQDTCFPAPSATPSSPEEGDSDKDIKVKSSVTSSKISSPDTALTAFCQLTVWRMGAQRAMIRLVVLTTSVNHINRRL